MDLIPLTGGYLAMIERLSPLDDDTIAISRVSRFVISLDGYVRRTAAHDPNDPRLDQLGVALVQARKLLAHAVSASSA